MNINHIHVGAMALSGAYNRHFEIIGFLTSLVALVSFGERPSLMRISTLFDGGFNGAARDTELSVTTNMAASRILQTSIPS